MRDEGVGVFRRLRQDNIDVFLCVLDWVPVRVLVCLGRADAVTAELARRVMCKRFDVGRVLSRFFSDPLRFRMMQLETEAVVAGECALEFFAEKVFGNVLEVYAVLGRAVVVGECLRNMGYSFAPSEGQGKELAEAVEGLRPGRWEQHPAKMRGCLSFVKGEDQDRREVRLSVGTDGYTAVEMAMECDNSECWTL